MGAASADRLNARGGDPARIPEARADFPAAQAPADRRNDIEAAYSAAKDSS